MTENKVEYDYRIVPRYSAWTEQDKVVLQVVLPGVNRGTIQMKALPDFLTLRANRDKVLYTLDLDLGLEIEPEKTKAEYNEGLLRIEMPRYKPLEHEYNVTIQ